MNPLILAAGTQQRWGEKPIKQLLTINDTTILERIVKYTKGIVVTRNQELISRFYPAIIQPDKYQYTSETLLSTLVWWEGRTVILLGDVIYSHNILDKIMQCQDKFRVFGNEWEIFALSFCSHIRIKDMLELTIKQAERGEVKGTLRNFCNNYFDVVGSIHHLANFENICHMTDYTNDVDS